MAFNPYIKQSLKYAVITSAILGIALLFLDVQNSGNLAGRLVASTDPKDVKTTRISADRILAGATIPKDTNVIFTIPDEQKITLSSFLGGSQYSNKRYWGYCFSGNEQENKMAGLTGRALYDGQYFYSEAEIAADLNRRAVARSGTKQDLLALRRMKGGDGPSEKESEITTLEGGQTCYVMSEVPLPVGLDQDGDGLNDEQERLAKTDPLLPDTDGDDLSDRVEVESGKTNPLVSDTDRDGLLDGIEDKNHNGIVDPGETSPFASDSDRDELCDGDGNSYGCPEPRKSVCKVTNLNRFPILYGGDDKVRDTFTTDCIERVTSPVQGEDINQNGIVDAGETNPLKPETNPGRTDWQWKYDQIVNKLRNQRGTFVGIGSGRVILPFQILSPNGGNVVPQGSRLDIRWSTGPDIQSPVTISLANIQRNQVLVTVVHETVNDGTEQWFVDAPTGNYVLLIELCKNCSSGYSFDYANAPIVITPHIVSSSVPLSSSQSSFIPAP